jgi:purine-binding chemotaxis protein CheW
MGRMADARKRARRPDAKKRPTPPGSPEPPGSAKPTASAEGPPEEAKGASASRIELPPSGLASEVLAQPEAATIEPAGEGEGEPPPGAPPAAAGTEGRGAQSLSFFTAPAREQQAAAEATEHLATFLLEGEEYGVDVRQVQEIRRVSEITTVPRAPEFVRGVVNLRGRILPVLDLKRKLGLGEVSMERAARIVVVNVEKRTLGLLVDGASQVLKVPVSRIEPPPEEVVERGGDYIRGVAKLEDRLIILIDLRRALEHELDEATAMSAG